MYETEKLAQVTAEMRHYFERGAQAPKHTWRAIQKLAQNGQEWQSFVAALYA